jgi:hypothetical protein
VPLSSDPERRAKQLGNLRNFPAAPAGNRRAATHGLSDAVNRGLMTSVMAPLYRDAEAWAEDRWPWLDETRRKLVAFLAAKVDRVKVWTVDEGSDILDRRGKHTVRAHPIIDSGDRWEARLWGLIRELDAEQRERERVDPFAELEAIAVELEAGKQ